MLISSIYSNIKDLQTKVQKLKSIAQGLECSPDLPAECFTALAGIIKDQAGSILIDLYNINNMMAMQHDIYDIDEE